jgi:hypothetical protein
MNWEGEAPAEPERQRLAIGDWRLANGEWRVANGERKSSTRNAQPNFTLHALRFQPISGLTPLLLANFTHYASRTTLHGSRS